jgi:hypothetical protein
MWHIQGPERAWGCPMRVALMQGAGPIMTAFERLISELGQFSISKE